ncbi:MAG: ABC transporter substrate-binding protein, partial [Bacillota bacterium]
MKRKLAGILALLLLIGALYGCAAQPAQTAPTPAPAAVTRAPAPAPEPTGEPLVSFTDSVGRTVEVPKDITKVAISGPLAQIVVFALAPDKLAGIASKWDKTAEQYLNTE